MKSRILAALLVALAAPLYAQPYPYSARQIGLAYSYDLDGEAADADQIVTAANGVIADATSYTITADPDACRLVDVTVTDADSSVTVGTLTVVGLDCWGQPLTVTFNLAGGSGVRTGTVTAGQASGAYFSDVTTVSNGAVTGEGGAGDTITVGYTGNSAKTWVLYGRQQENSLGGRRVDIFGSYQVNQAVINGAATTDVTALSASTSAPFTNVAVGDVLVFNVGGATYERIVASRADADTITINAGLALPSTGATFSYRERFVSTDPIDGWIPVAGYDVVTFFAQVDANVSTGGVVTSIECAALTVDGPTATWDVLFEEDTATVASGAAGTDITTIDLRTKPQYTHCRASVKFGTGDDGDGAAEDVDLVVGFRR